MGGGGGGDAHLSYNVIFACRINLSLVLRCIVLHRLTSRWHFIHKASFLRNIAFILKAALTGELITAKSSHVQGTAQALSCTELFHWRFILFIHVMHLKLAVLKMLFDSDLNSFDSC